MTGRPGKVQRVASHGKPRPRASLMPTAGTIALYERADLGHLAQGTLAGSRTGILAVFATRCPAHEIPERGNPDQQLANVSLGISAGDKRASSVGAMERALAAIGPALHVVTAAAPRHKPLFASDHRVLVFTEPDDRHIMHKHLLLPFVG
eukprot:CAMPEP_0181177002 /NCGR_PEP_ID=MMETSP1096-20121128/4932_1 /TAXON_ID=156174 ORGANISM="Chrysochromulina ericina, Strain CCMP281" /NCGR_SAMPLE_ID=MMETSP1096 /ASSEMBLY_ACC=CAM_ASM_000453 /LENGTH=149 /DNA_ID=CAMNT_0023265131 /DNA_START=946 /DNA_END=1397 /DNA_ORIENTATION=-